MRSTFKSRLFDERENIHALREMLNDILYRIDKNRKRRDSFVVNNLNRALEFLKYAEDPDYDF